MNRADRRAMKYRPSSPEARAATSEHLMARMSELQKVFGNPEDRTPDRTVSGDDTDETAE